MPNLELLELPQDSGFSYACGGQAAKFKEREQAIHRRLAEGAVAAGADTIVTMYHSCHRALSGAEAVYPLKVVNFTDVIAEALGRGGHPDYYRLYKAGGAMDEAVAAARTFLTNNGVRIDEASVQSLTADIFNETGLAGSREAFRAGLHGAGEGRLALHLSFTASTAQAASAKKRRWRRQLAGEAAIDLVGRGLHHHADRRGGGEVGIAPRDLARLHRLGDHLAHDGHRIGRVVGHLDQEGVLVQRGDRRTGSSRGRPIRSSSARWRRSWRAGPWPRRCASASASASAR